METCICEFPNHRDIIENLLKYPHDPSKCFDLCRITPGIPVKP